MRISAFALLLCLSFISCEKIFLPDNPAGDPISTFDYLWKTLDENYSYFDLKNVDWDSVYNVYRPMVSAQITDQQLFYIMADMLQELRDGHINLRSEFDISKYFGYYLPYPRNFDYHVLEANYLGSDYSIVPPLVYHIIDSVGYIRYGSFAAPLTERDLDIALTRMQGLKGLIIDIRDNEGGDPVNGWRIIRRVADQRRLVLRHHWKNGPGHNDFSEFNEIYLEPQGEIRFDGPVALLTNRFCYSAANYFAAEMKAFPNVTQIGDWTGGGGGVPLGAELPNGFSVNFSASAGYMPDGTNLEPGIEPDIRVDMDPDDQLEGKDSILERALDELR